MKNTITFFTIFIMISCSKSQQVKMKLINNLHFVDSTNLYNNQKSFNVYDYYLAKNFTSKSKDSVIIFEFLKKLKRPINTNYYSVTILRESAISNEKELKSLKNLSLELEYEVIYNIAWRHKFIEINSYSNRQIIFSIYRDSL